jgi:hypothetical protein
MKQEVVEMAEYIGVESSPVLIEHGVLMVGQAIVLSVLGSFISNSPNFELGYKIATTATALGLLIPSALFLISSRRVRQTQPIGIPLLAAVSVLAYWFVFWILQGAPSGLPAIVLVAGLHGSFWASWYIRLAFIFQDDTRKAALFSVLAASTATHGIVLGTQSELSKLSAVTAVAWFSLFIGIQILLVAAYLHGRVISSNTIVVEYHSKRVSESQTSHFAPSRGTSGRLEPAQESQTEM